MNNTALYFQNEKSKEDNDELENIASKK